MSIIDNTAIYKKWTSGKIKILSAFTREVPSTDFQKMKKTETGSSQ